MRRVVRATRTQNSSSLKHQLSLQLICGTRRTALFEDALTARGGVVISRYQLLKLWVTAQQGITHNRMRQA